MEDRWPQSSGAGPRIGPSLLTENGACANAPPSSQAKAPTPLPGSRACGARVGQALPPAKITHTLRFRRNLVRFSSSRYTATMALVSFSIGAFLALAGVSGAQNIVVDAAPSHAVNSFSPLRALGGAIDRLRGGNTKEANEKYTERLLTDPVLKEMLGAGWQTVTYRQNTELMIEAWHWNERGTWSNAAKQEGYFTGSAERSEEHTSKLQSLRHLV